MAEEIDCENRHFCNFKSHMTLTLTPDDLESHIVENVSLTLTNNTIWFVAALSLIVDVQTDGRTYGRTDGWTFLPGLLGHLRGDDLKEGTFPLTTSQPRKINSIRKKTQFILVLTV